MKNSISPQVALLYQVATLEGLVDNFGIARAAAQCLSPDELYQVLITEASASSQVRDAVLRRVVQDEGLTAELDLNRLCAALISQLQTADARGRQGLGYCLSTICSFLSDEAQSTVVLTLTESNFIGLRRRGYKICGKQSNPDLNKLHSAWVRFKDPECARLLIRLLDVTDLWILKSELLQVLDEPWMVSRLYLKLAESDRKVLIELKAIDIVSYCYVCAKLGNIFSDKEARECIKRTELDDRFGLVVWSIGRMRLFRTLRWLKSELPAINQRKSKHMLARYDA